MINKEEITKAYQRIAPFIRRTPVVESGAGTFGLPFSINMKLEQVQHSGSFKARGAFNSLLQMKVPEGGVAAASGGNHGAAVACAASALGHKAKIFVPEISNPAKIKKIRHYGAEVHVEGAAYADAAALCARHQEETGAIDIHAYDAPGTINGQGTVALEWAAQAPDLDTVLVAVGGGGLIGGMSCYYQNGIDVIAVEPGGACSLHAALAANEPVDVEVNSVAANSLGAKRCGTHTFALAKEYVSQSVLVNDADILDAQARLWTQMQLAVEPGAATALAALISGAYQPKQGERVGVLVCGGNADLGQLEQALG
ncbi:threonine/serine dehydratase [Pseudovibrio exalbescens]|uniref:threonine/serine dehydratase n=1 Tax=Pseudovibrio exalbescens TaxID=197461 RepID=UPI00236637F2|nr:threonine/serine dehydratase [Pseudovibrio exalbescens]MDD7911724.1 threonine/serine dehydratase [Pseudovibrio exalbescens]